MNDDWGHSRTRSTAALVVGCVAFVLVTLMAAAAVYMATRIALLDKQVAQLQATQGELKDAIQALKPNAPFAHDVFASPNVIGAPATAPSSPGAQAPVTNQPAPGMAPPAAGANAQLPGPTANAAPAQANAPQPAPASERYSVRIFAAVEARNKGKLDRFVGVIRSLGFDVDVSETNISDSMNSSILYQPTTENIATRLANGLKTKYPALNFEMNVGPVNDNLKRVLIISLNQDAL